jgi:hypothetical protein
MVLILPSTTLSTNFCFIDRNSLAVVVSTSDWSFYVESKNWSEVFVLLLQLLIAKTSTSGATASANSYNSKGGSTGDGGVAYSGQKSAVR